MKLLLDLAELVDKEYALALGLAGGFENECAAARLLFELFNKQGIVLQQEQWGRAAVGGKEGVAGCAI